jgi:hypothetical protein
MVLHRPVEAAGVIGMWLLGPHMVKFPQFDNPNYLALRDLPRANFRLSHNPGKIKLYICISWEAVCDPNKLQQELLKREYSGFESSASLDFRPQEQVSTQIGIGRLECSADGFRNPDTLSRGIVDKLGDLSRFGLVQEVSHNPSFQILEVSEPN